MDDAEIRKHVERYREAIEHTDFAQPYEGSYGRPYDGNMARFPGGCCSDASFLLFLQFRKLGLADFQVVQGRLRLSRRQQNHHWLERNGLVVDITADQFPDLDLPPVIVTRKSAWHDAIRRKLEIYPEEGWMNVAERFRQLGFTQRLDETLRSRWPGQYD